MAVQAGARLLQFGHALRLPLVDQHVGVAPFLAVIEGETVAGKDAAPGRVFVEMLERLAAAMVGALRVHRPLVAVVVPRIVLAPDGRIIRAIADLDDPEHVLGRLRLAGDDVAVEHQDEVGGAGGAEEDEQIDPGGETATVGGRGGVHAKKRAGRRRKAKRRGD
jgi:hypothetical protein